MLIFVALNALGVAFLVYVLVQFWKEGHRPKRRARQKYAIEYSQENKPEVIVVTRLISGGLQVRPAPVSGGLQGEPGLSSRGLQVEPASVPHNAHGGLSVVSRPARIDGQQVRQDRIDSAEGAADRSLKRLSTK
jgi:hypothetical protein